jgi:hypothetical protein
MMQTNWMLYCVNKKKSLHMKRQSEKSMNYFSMLFWRYNDLEFRIMYVIRMNIRQTSAEDGIQRITILDTSPSYFWC